MKEGQNIQAMSGPSKGVMHALIDAFIAHSGQEIAASIGLNHDTGEVGCIFDFGERAYALTPDQVDLLVRAGEKAGVAQDFLAEIASLAADARAVGAKLVVPN